ncbi:hypothetical protein BDP55DRAFT_268445 [Colletotrichum godetiae]|uniref:Uncharacterized protein n=1 Tax=Colletotrichum godetiae TaxID=1209918 RepID=A0AAJ0EYZ6_9PEZI|nr:uncharacterized protein BDP55DRAFT_268445 [Colletotrichum godetiae]KAK1691585.1 hypothetical protein BDP55DRAFT_268445 [Colletotrichum godetiae]
MRHDARCTFWKARGYARGLSLCTLAWNGSLAESVSSTGASTVHCRLSVSSRGTRSGAVCRLEMKLNAMVPTTPWKS